MHPTFLCVIKAQKIIEQILAAVKLDRWKVQGHGADIPSADSVCLPSHYGKTEEGEGGFTLNLISYLFPPGSRGHLREEDSLKISFNFSRGENIVSSVVFSHGLDSGLWYAVHEPTEFLLPEMEDPAARLAQQLGLELKSRFVEPVEGDRALEKIAIAADYAFDRCDDPAAEAPT